MAGVPFSRWPSASRGKRFAPSVTVRYTRTRSPMIAVADHDTRAVVDEEARADARARMNVDTRFRMRLLGDDPREQRQAGPYSSCASR